MLGEFFGLPVDTLWEIVTSALVPAGTLDTLSALNVPGCPKASGGLTRSLWAEMVFPDVGGPEHEKRAYYGRFFAFRGEENQGRGGSLGCQMGVGGNGWGWEGRCQ